MSKTIHLGRRHDFFPKFSPNKFFLIAQKTHFWLFQNFWRLKKKDLNFDKNIL